jgi:3-hydroxyisobutyrate dehydrogenase-like beta-hydroxyacid dehydrogenase
MQPLLDAGASGASSVAAAVVASPVIVTCVDNYTVTRNLLGSNEVAEVLAGRTLVEISTGTPKEAREAEAWAQSRVAEYLDGTIMAYPEHLGQADTRIMASCKQPVFDRCKSFLEHLGGNICYLGPNVGAVAAVTCAILVKYLGQVAGAVHGARLCESEGVGIDLFASMLPKEDRIQPVLQIIHENAYANPGATMSLWNDIVERIQQQGRDANINCEVPNFISGLVQRAIALGHADEHIAALLKVLHQSA